ncbi:MAG: KpsF/GutQ family sugar-phosphate isomerase [Phycisphaerales bacterium]
MTQAPSTSQTAEAEFIADVLRAEADAISALIPRLGEGIHRAVTILCERADAGGSVVVTGLGKSRIIGAKISATLASLGVPSHEIHPSDALHGDLGRIRAEDALLALSNSGETEEVVAIAAIVKQDGIPIISITGGDGHSALANLADVALSLGQITEASDLGLAPTCSTTATLALGDAIALAMARRRAFTSDQFARHHPGGSLGGLLRPVTDVLRFTAGHNLPLVSGETSVRDALAEASKLHRRPGALMVVDDAGALAGIFTDGDLRRTIIDHPEHLDAPIRDVMTKNPTTLTDRALVRDAVRIVREHRRDEIPVVDENGMPVGILDVQDLIAMRVVQAPKHS